MSKDKLENDAKKRVREETEPIKRSEGRRLEPEKPENPGGFRDLFEDMWSEMEDSQDSNAHGMQQG